MPKMKDFITLIENNRKSAVYIWLNIHVIYTYLEIIGSPTTLTTSSQSFHNFVPSSFKNNDTSSLQLVIAALHMI